MRRFITVLLSLVLLQAPLVLAEGDIVAGPYGMVVSDILLSFHADEVPCEGGATDLPEICFKVDSVGVAYLAERLSALVESYTAAGLEHGDWRAANGVWAITLEFRHDAFGRLELYLAESMGAGVRGLARLVIR